MLRVDHCHKTGKVRALLCNRCNITVGRFEQAKDANLFPRFMEYLKYG